MGGSCDFSLSFATRIARMKGSGLLPTIATASFSVPPASSRLDTALAHIGDHALKQRHEPFDVIIAEA